MLVHSLIILAAATPFVLASPALLPRQNPTNTATDSSASLYPAADRFTIIKNAGPEYLKFDFNVAANPGGGVSSGLGGQGNLANRRTFPALIGLGVAMSAGFLNPCGMNTPHIHNRATEFLMIVQGGNVRTGFILENGLTTQMSTTLDMFQGAIFPQGSIHFEFNDNCEAAVFTAAFSNEDPGLSSIANNFFSLDPNIVNADLGYPRFLDGTNIAQFESTIPKSFALGMRECLTRCGINHGDGRQNQ